MSREMNPSSRHSHPAAALIVIGGFAGTGKTT
jgi:hypothetical protein